MKAVVAAFNQEKALVVEPMDSFTALILDTAESDLDDHISGLGQVHGDVAPREVAVADADVTNLGIKLTIVEVKHYQRHTKNVFRG